MSKSYPRHITYQLHTNLRGGHQYGLKLSKWVNAQVSLISGLQVGKRAPSVKFGWELAKEEKHSRQKEHSVGYKWKNNQSPWVESTHGHNASAHFNMSAPFYLSVRGHWFFKSMSISGFYLVIHSIVPTCIPNQYNENIFLYAMFLNL